MKILFVCSGNTCRSPMAHMMFERMCSENNLDIECRGAGTETMTGIPASDHSVNAMREIGIDLSGYRSTSIRALLLDEFDLFVPMTYIHALILMQLGVPKSKIYMFSNDVSDPYGGDIDRYRRTRDEIEEHLKGLLEFVQNK
ncbi:MAG: low molecular weight phosphatase family protein [Oscillospiraceae bacterium]|nr:low molecular weight phosphatase family protein [Oscillospiraceae bacterium]